LSVPKKVGRARSSFTISLTRGPIRLRLCCFELLQAQNRSDCLVQIVPIDRVAQALAVIRPTGITAQQVARYLEGDLLSLSGGPDSNRECFKTVFCN